MARGQIGGDLQAFRGGGGQQRQANVDNKACRINAGGNGPKTLLEGLIETEKKNISDDEDRKTVEKEIAYIRKHQTHMDYRSARKNGIPCGSGAVESLCSQLQNRFKRRGQFWSKDGFGLFLRTYIWYTNGELDYVYSRAA